MLTAPDRQSRVKPEISVSLAATNYNINSFCKSVKALKTEETREKALRWPLAKESVMALAPVTTILSFARRNESSVNGINHLPELLASAVVSLRTLIKWHATSSLAIFQGAISKSSTVFSNDESIKFFSFGLYGKTFNMNIYCR